MKRTNYHFIASDYVKIHTYKWENEQNDEPRAIIQIAHGMAEHILRYEPFAQFLTENEFIVIGNDHRGHGANIIAPDDHGFFTDENGFERVALDMHELTNKIKKDYPQIPIILFGHSMGSFLSRRYIQLHGDDIHGVVICGTGGDQGIVGKAGLAVAHLEKRRIGKRTPSTFMDKMAFGQYNNQFKPNRTQFDWLSRDEEQVDTYIEDGLCGFICSSGFFADLLYGIHLIHKKSEVTKTPKNLPIYFIAGDKDPVGDNGKGVQRTAKLYETIGCTNVSITLYEGARHEILNEINSNEVYEDILTWIEETLTQLKISEANA